MAAGVLCLFLAMPCVGLWSVIGMSWTYLLGFWLLVPLIDQNMTKTTKQCMCHLSVHVHEETMNSKLDNELTRYLAHFNQILYHIKPARATLLSSFIAHWWVGLQTL